MANFIQDLKFAARTLRSNLGFTVAALIALALGTGANTAVFSVVNSILIRPLPYDKPDRIVVVWGNNQKTHRTREPVSVPDLIDFREQSSLVEQIASFVYDDFSLSIGAEPERIQGTMVSANFFNVLGVKPALGRVPGVKPAFGRLFVEGEDASSSGRSVVLSNKLWKERFGSDPSIVEKTIQLNGAAFTVVGITPPEFQSPEKGDELWVPMAFDGADRLRLPSISSPDDLRKRNRRFLKCIARLKPGVGIQQAQSEMATVASRLEQAYPNSNSGFTVDLVPISDQILGNIRPALKFLLVTVALVLLIACANVANLLLARGAARQKEIAIRTAMGASRSRIIVQLLTESVLIALTGGALGLALAYGGVKLLLSINPANVPRLSEVGIDLRVLLFTLMASVVTGLLFGAIPAIQASKPDLNSTLKEGVRGTSGGSRGKQTRHTLVVLEVALTQVVLIAAALMLKSFYQLQNVDPGFNPERVLTMQVTLPPTKYTEDDQISAFFDQSIKRLASLPGVEAAGAITTLPLQPDTALARRFTIDGRAPSSPDERLTAAYGAVSSDYFKLMSIPLLKGRYFEERDRDKSPPVIVINDAMARLYWGQDDPLGKHISITAEGGVSREIIGIVGNVKQSSLDSESGAQMYEPFLQVPWNFMALVLRTTQDPNSIMRASRAELLSIDPGQPVFDVKTMDQLVGESISQPRLYTTLVAIFAILALALAAIGIYGVISYAVTQRTQEIGIRMALGAAPSTVLKMMVGQAMFLTGIGLILGIVAAFLSGRLLADLLFGVSERDVTVFLVIPCVLAAVALVSSYLPARRATRVDPMLALRAE